VSAVREATRRLLEVLAVEERLYLRMRDLLQREREHMATLDADALMDVAQHKEALADEGRLVEESRVAVAGELAAALGLGEARPSLSRLCAALGPEAEELREAHTRLVVLVSVVRELLDANAALAGDHLMRIRGTLQLLGRLVPEDTLYRAGVGLTHGETPGRLVRRSA
jgi:hypothetical protein